MKKVGSLLSILLLLLGLCGCTYRNPVIDSLPQYNSRLFYTSGGFQDYTDYAKYFYESVTVQNLEASEYFAAATTEDVEEILLYIGDFEGWADMTGGEFKEHYDFDKAAVSEGDFFYIQTRYGEPIGDGTYGKFDDYTVYYFDVDAQILYYFHSNI